MKKHVLSLDAGRQKISEILNTLDNLLTSGIEQAYYWEILMAVRSLDGERVAYARLVTEYQANFAKTHWTVGVVLDNIAHRILEIGELIDQIRGNLYRAVSGDIHTSNKLIRQQLIALLTNTRQALDTEQNLLLKMIGLLMITPLPNLYN